MPAKQQAARLLQRNNSYYGTAVRLSNWQLHFYKVWWANCNDV